MDVIKAVNLGLRFLLELGAIAAFGYWGFKVGNGQGMKILLGIGAPVIMIAIWALFIAPHSTVGVADAAKALAGFVILEAAAAALVAAGQAGIGIAYGAIVAMNAVLIWVWGQ